jgi:hypothetical protein
LYFFPLPQGHSLLRSNFIQPTSWPEADEPRIFCVACAARSDRFVVCPICCLRATARERDSKPGRRMPAFAKQQSLNSSRAHAGPRRFSLRERTVGAQPLV